MNNMKRMRGRNHRGGGGGPTGGGGGGGGSMRHGGAVPLNRNHVFDSNGPDVRVRGTAQQLFEKYLQLGRDATSGGDRVMAEGYFQHAEHYFRVLNAINQAAQQTQQNGQFQPRRYPGQDEQGQVGFGDPEDGEGRGELPRYEGGRIDQGRQEGRQEGRAEGRPEGRPEGRQDGRSEPRQEGRVPGAGEQPDTRDIPIAAAPPAD